MSYHTIFGRASITNDTAWATWKSYCLERYSIDHFTDLSFKGISNKTIISKCFYEAKKKQKPFYNCYAHSL